MQKDILDAKKIVDTIQQLCLRIEDRFPLSGLLETAKTLHAVARETHLTIRWIERPNYLFRVLGILFIMLVLLGMVSAVSMFGFKAGEFGLSGLIQLTEAAVNELILIGAAAVFIVTYEVRRKRKRVVSALSQLRSIAHVIDAHQLTKDPDSTAKTGRPTQHSPKRSLTPYELGRYLDYCSELLSLTGKVAFLYVQKFDDPVSVNAVNDLENLTTGLSRKIWQKIMLIHAAENANGAPPAQTGK
jgi:hypothetical protein